MSGIIDSNLFDSALLSPARDSGANRLCIVTGYASPSMASYHLEQLKDIPVVKIDLVVGMSVKDGLSLPEKMGFQKILENNTNFDCRYVVNAVPVHSKAYIWCQNDKPMYGFVGSANYTQTAFLNNIPQREILNIADPQSCKNYFDSIFSDTADLEDYRVTALLDLYKQNRKGKSLPSQTNVQQSTNIYLQLASPSGTDSVTISQIDRNGGCFGLNWGQRPNRNPNESYLRVPAEIARTRFFPPRGQHFTVITDDGHTLLCTMAQDGPVDDKDLGKGIHTTRDNSLMGIYMRNRLGLADGQRIEIGDLNRYGRTDITFTKIDDDTYIMDFSV